MDLNYLKKILKVFNESGVEELNIEEEGLKLRLKKASIQHNVIYSSDSLPHDFHKKTDTIQPNNVPNQKVEEIKTQESKSTQNLHEIKSPIVGTFYRAPSPDSEPFVSVGDVISSGTVLCIIEAMKLMNEIESDVNGRILQILVENGKPVEYGQPLFVIEKT